MSLGETMMAGALVQGARRDTQMAYREINRLNGEIDKANRAYSELVDTYQSYVAHARAQIHYHRSAIYARKKIMAQMSDEIAKYDPTSPFASMEKTQKLVEQQINKSLCDPKVVSMTYAQNEVRDIGKHVEHYYADSGDENHPCLVIRRQVT